MKQKLSLKQCLQWAILKILKEQPLTVDECYRLLEKQLPPPPQPGSPNRKYSIYKLRTYLKDLEEEGEIISANDSELLSYSITKKGYEREKARGKELLERVTVVHHALNVILESLLDLHPVAPKIVPNEDREFVRSLLSVKDIIRVYILRYLTNNKQAALSDLQRDMISEWGWTCSKTYFLLVGRNEMTEGLDEDNEPLENPTILLKSTYTGQASRKHKREYSILDKNLVAEWSEIYLESAINSLREAITFNETLLALLEKN
ncbi:hypothetical protein BpOF4_21244 (plasmid) [Alkalihalophilus pseudofirmus OF4]|uniref:Transcription regulator PadR N-terminal domain-containing protein n=1 Tax=Alkalihalophilus pseudofirmus (strain ATCC BAA-2126 / JCM 17055 / OF4) TaxID=398511 RepID=D3G1L8_ALKPO|nr:hypothetical protein [Alkalihalophilus pseudofirmus]ADC52244.1 hypothetical protein BpOF4_21244 [Alkalihalophilus pseudofirmus OF4]